MAGSVLAIAPLLAAQTPLTFDEALATARQQNQSLRAAEAHVEEARATRAARRGLYYPSVTLNGLYAHLNDRLFVDLESLRPLLSALNPAVPIPPLTATVLENDPYKLGLTGHWLVFAGGRIVAANRAAEAGVSAAQAQRRAAGDRVITELVDRYFKRRLAADVLLVREQALETLTKHMEDARRLKAAGQIARTDELRAEVALAEADREFKKAARDVELADVALKSTLGIHHDVVPTTPLSLISSLEPRAEFSDLADSANALVAHLAAAKEQAHQGTAIAKGSFFPAVSLYGGYEFFDQGLNDTADPKWLVGVLARWNLFNGFTRENEFQAAKHLEQAIGFEHAHAQDEVNTLVQQRYDEYESALEQFNALGKTLSLAEESLRSEQKAYEAAVGTSLDVIDAQLARSRARIDRLTALFDLNLALAQLLEVSGQSERFVEYLDQATPAEDMK